MLIPRSELCYKSNVFLIIIFMCDKCNSNGNKSKRVGGMIKLPSRLRAQTPVSSSEALRIILTLLATQAIYIWLVGQIHKLSERSSTLARGRSIYSKAHSFGFIELWR